MKRFAFSGSLPKSRQIEPRVDTCCSVLHARDVLSLSRQLFALALAVLISAGSAVVCAGWVRFELGTHFATFWGGGTVPAWRGRGIYRAMVAYRANLAAERGFRFIQVDASSNSRPILERLGFVAVTTTTPYVWSPPATVP